MIEDVLKKELIYKLDFLDLNILKEVVGEGYFISLPTLSNRMKKINVWSNKIVRRRIKRLKELKILYYEEEASPLIIEVYSHQDKELDKTIEMLSMRIMR